MCRVTVGETPADEALQRLQQELEQLQLQQAGQCGIPDLRGIAGCKGSGPRLFCGHVPKEATEDLVRAHFSRWGTVTDVYFPRHKKTLKRRPFCFVTFVSLEAAERALAESPLNICGIPIKNLTMVEDRDAYYRTKHATTRAALLQALQSIGNSPNGQLGPDQLNNLAALLAMEGVTAEAIMALLPQGNGMPYGSLDPTSVLLGAGRYTPDGLPNLLGADAMRSMSTSAASSMYDGYVPQMGQRMPSPAAPFPQNGGRYAPSPMGGYGAPSPLPSPLEAHQQMQQALLASRLSPQPPVSAALLQQYGGGLQYGAPQPQYQAPPLMHQPQPQYHQAPPMQQQQQLFPQQPMPQPPANWGLAGQQPMRSHQLPLGPVGMMGAPGPSSSGSHSSGSGSPLQSALATPQLSLDEALAALSKLKAAQTTMPEAPRVPAPPSAEILAGLGSFTSNSPALSSPNLGTSPPSDGSGLLGAGSLWAADARSA